MKKILVAMFVLAIGLSFAQDSASSTTPTAQVVVRKIKIRHADPELILRLLRGQRVSRPEISTVDNARGN